MENKININNIIYKNYALGNQDGIQKFYLPSNQNFVSCSLVEGMKGNDYINVNVKKLRTVMNELGHTHIDLLKLDIEGSECDVIENMLNEEIYPKYLAVEFDLAFNGENIKDVEKCNNIIQLLYQKNYELIYQNHSDFTFYYKNIKKYDDKKILFLLNNPGPPDRAQYQHTLISFAEGLKEQNINYDANINYYKTSDEKYLFNKIDNINYNNYDYIITSPNSHYLKECHYKENDNIFITKEYLSKKNRNYKLVMIDWSDGFFNFIEYLEYYDFYFKSTYQNNILPNINKNIYPCVFNSTNRIINATKNNNNWESRTINLLYSHRVSHEIRGYMLELYKNYDSFITFYNDNFKIPNINDIYYNDWCQTGRRHNPDFYETLKKTKIVDCSGGFIKNINNELVLCQIDSFKLWESFFAGCCVIMMDLDLFNIKFPVQPENMIHYIGITLNSEKDKLIIEDIINGKIDIKKIAQNGYDFVKKHYSPIEFSKYILNIIK